MAWLWSRPSAMEIRIIAEIRHVMSAISEFAARFDAYQTKITSAVDGLTSDIADLKAAIAELQATAGNITPEDQALLDGIEAKAKTISEKLEALDSMTPPVLPAA